MSSLTTMLLADVSKGGPGSGPQGGKSVKDMSPSERAAAILSLRQEAQRASETDEFGNTKEQGGDERAMGLIRQAREIETYKPKPPKGEKTPKKNPKGWNADGTMDVMGGYVLDMKDHGRLIGTRNEDGTIRRR